MACCNISQNVRDDVAEVNRNFAATLGHPIPPDQGGGVSFPRAGAILDLDFANGKYFYKGATYTTLDDLVAQTDFDFSRNTQAWNDDGSQSYNANVPRVIPGVGFMAEEARTQYLSNPAVPATQTKSLAAGNYCLFVKGSGSVTLSGGPTGVATEGAFVTFNLAATTSVTFTVAGSLTWMNCQNQLYPTSPILAATAPFTRLSDVLDHAADLSSLSAGYTLLIEGKTAQGYDPSAGNNSQNAAWYNGATDRFNAARDRNTNTVSLAVIAGATGISTGFPASNSAPIKMAVRIKANDHAISVNGSDPAKVTNAGMPSLTTGHIGRGAGSAQAWNGKMSRFSIVPAMVDADLSQASDLVDTNVLAMGDSLTNAAQYPAQFPTGFTPRRDMKLVQSGGNSAPQILALMQATPSFYYKRTAIIWAGTNQGYLFPQAMKDAIASMVALLGHNRYMVVSPINGDYANERSGGSGVNPKGVDYDTIIANENYLATTYGTKFYSIRRQLIDNGLAALGITPTSQDVIDVADDIVPQSLRGAGDPRHPTIGANSGASFIAGKFRDKLIALGY
jgi:hypothetical protein